MYVSVHEICTSSVVVEYYIFSRPGINSYKDGIGLKYKHKSILYLLSKVPKDLSQANVLI